MTPESRGDRPQQSPEASATTGPPVLRPVKSRAMRWALNGVGLVSLGLGALGVALPLLPTTPFLLLSALCFAKASDRLLNYLLNHRVFGSYLNQYYSGQMTLAYKLQTLGVMWIGLIVSAWLIGRRPSLTPMRNTASHSSPFAAWKEASVIPCTAGAC